MSKKYSSRKELKSLAVRFGEKNNLDYKDIEILLIEVDRLKSRGTLPDLEILIRAIQKLKKEYE